MKTTETTRGLVNVEADHGHRLYFKDTDPHEAFSRVTVKPSDVGRLVEIPAEDVPRYSRQRYCDKVNELIRERYSVSDEFAINRKLSYAMLPMSTMAIGEEDADTTSAQKAIEEFRQYSEYAEQCKVVAQELLSVTEEA